MLQKYKSFFTPTLKYLFPLGIISGLPLALSGTTLQAWFTVEGMDLKTIGFMALVGQPYVYKFLWAPLLDRFYLPFLDRRRGWMLLLQAIMTALIFSFAFLSPQITPFLIASIAAMLAFASASFDVCCDAYRTDILPAEERGIGAALFVGGYRVAMLLSGGLALIMADKFGFSATFIFLAALMAVGLVATMLTPAISAAIKAPATMKAAIVEPFKEFFSRKNAVLLLLLIVLYKLGDAFAGTLTTAFLIRDLNFTLSEVGTVTKFFGLAATLIGMLWGGALMVRWGLYRSLFYFGILQAVSNFCYYLLSIIGHNFGFMITAVFIENLCGGMGTAAFVAFVMSLCNKSFSATQFALLSALAAIGRIYVGPTSGVMVEYMGWSNFFLWTVVFSIPGLLLLWALRHHTTVTNATNTNASLSELD